ncbi:hypothetical protein RCL1_000382 [Eukaryota sp. TZLM3-RCL]
MSDEDSNTEPDLVDNAFDLVQTNDFTNKDSLVVYVRIRPSASQPVLFSSSNSNITLKEPSRQNFLREARRKTHSFSFDHVFPPTTTQEEVFNTGFLPFVSTCLSERKNVTAMAYGCTSSGKSYSLFGSLESSETYGLIPRIFKSLVESDFPCTFSVSFVELYNERCYDLLSSTPTVELSLRENHNGQVIINNLSHHQVNTSQDFMTLLISGLETRKTFATQANQNSSRSHAILTFSISLPNHEPFCFRLVDMAGSERACNSTNTGLRHIESSIINKSLLALGAVINSLSSGKKTHISFRHSKLTRLLKEAFIGNSKTIMLSTVDPGVNSYEESLNTLRYASKAANISTKCISSSKPVLNQEEILHYEKVIEQLRDDIRAQGQRLSDCNHFLKDECRIRDEVIYASLVLLTAHNIGSKELQSFLIAPNYSKKSLFSLLKILKDLHKNRDVPAPPPPLIRKSSSTTLLNSHKDEIFVANIPKSEPLRRPESEKKYISNSVSSSILIRPPSKNLLKAPSLSGVGINQSNSMTFQTNQFDRKRFGFPARNNPKFEQRKAVTLTNMNASLLDDFLPANDTSTKKIVQNRGKVVPKRPFR